MTQENGRTGREQPPSASNHDPKDATLPQPDGPGPDDSVDRGEFERQHEKIGTFYAFRYRNYRLLWSGDFFTSIAMWIQQTSMGWLVYDLTSSGSLLGVMNGIRVVPQLLLSPIAGAASDRISRNRIIAVSQFAQFVFTFLLALGVVFGAVHVWSLLLFTVLIAGCQSFNMPARQTFVFDLVPRHVIPNALGLSNFAFSLARSIGPALGGLLIVLFGPADNFFIQSVAYLSVMTTVMMVRMPPTAPRPARPRRAFFGDMAEGYKFAIQNPQARILLLMMIIYPSFIIPMHNALMPIFAKNIFHSGAGGLGILLSAIGAGGIIGGLITASVNDVDRRGLLQLGALFVCSLSQAAFAIVGGLTGELWIAVWFLVLSGIGGSLFNTTNQTVVQLLAPDHMRGRITGVLQVSPLFMSIGSLAAGAAADFVPVAVVGATFSLLAFGVGVAILIFSPRMRELRLSSLGENAPEGKQAAAGA